MIRKSRVALLLALATGWGTATAADLSLSVEIPQLPVAEYHRPYVAIWIEGADQTIAANLAVWYQVRGDHTKWLPDLRQWWRRGGRDLKVPVDGLTGATRPVGQHLLKFVNPRFRTIHFNQQHRIRIQRQSNVVRRFHGALSRRRTQP